MCHWLHTAGHICLVDRWILVAETRKWKIVFRDTWVLDSWIRVLVLETCQGLCFSAGLVFFFFFVSPLFSLPPSLSLFFPPSPPPSLPPFQRWTDSPASTSQVLELQVCPTMSDFTILFKKEAAAGVSRVWVRRNINSSWYYVENATMT